MDDILDPLGFDNGLDDTGDGTGSLLLSSPATSTPVSTNATTPAASSSGSWFSSLLGVVNPLSTDASSVLNAVNGTATPATAAAAATASSNMIMYLVLGGIALLAFVFLLGRK